MLSTSLDLIDWESFHAEWRNVNNSAAARNSIQFDSIEYWVLDAKWLITGYSALQPRKWQLLIGMGQKYTTVLPSIMPGRDLNQAMFGKNVGPSHKFADINVRHT